MKKATKTGTSEYGIQRITPYSWVLMVLVAVGAMLVPILLSLDTSMVARYSLKKYQVGELCDEDVYAPATFEFIDEAKTKEALEEAQRAVLPTFTYSLNETLRATSRMAQFIDAWQNYSPEEASVRVRGMLEREGLTDSQQIVDRYASLSADDRSQLLLASQETMQNLLGRGVYSEQDFNTVRAQGYTTFLLKDMPGSKGRPTVAIEQMASKDNLEKNMTSWLEAYTVSIKGYQLVLLEDTMQLLITENVRYDRNLTLLERDQAKSATAPIYVTVTKGQKILEKDKVITASQVALLEEAARHRTAYSMLELIGWSVYTVMITACAVVVFLMFIPHSPRKYQYLRFAMVAVLLSEVAAYFIIRYTKTLPYDLKDSVIPYILAPLFVSQVSDKKRYGAVIAFLMAAYSLLLPGSTIMTFFICLTNGAICVFFFQHADRKVENIYHWLYACITCIFTELALSLVGDVSLAALMPVIGVLTINITFSVAVCSLSVSICESIFNLPTENRLNELAFSHSPLLDRLEMAAVGTYNHSLNVSELAFESAKAIGANAMLARVGGLYHDIGKMDYPEYFVENQGDENKQNDLKPSLSVAIIKSHVKTGIEKGRQEGLPAEILDIIGEHHGNDVISFFYRKAQDQAGDDADLVSKNDYRYDAPLPDSKEAALVMICDSVEAASHTVKKPTPGKFEKLVHTIIMQKIEHGQLGESHLSLTDLDVVSKTLTKSLIGRNHHRIEYPKETNASGEDMPKQPVYGPVNQENVNENE